MEEKKLVPKLRFPGFTEPWEQRKFKNFVQIRRGLTYKPSDIASSGIRVLRSSNINEDQFITGTNDVFVNIDAVDIPYVKSGDILLTSANGSAHLVGKHAIINDIVENSAVHGGFMLLVESKNPQFINALLGSNWYKKFINLYVSGGNGAIGNLSKSDLEEQDVMFPSEEEQKAIGRVYFYMNHLITLHQRKLEHLKLKKKSLLQKLFPKEGEVYPELRFPGFTDPWEQRKLGELASFSKGNGYFKSDLKSTGIPIILYGRLYTKYETVIEDIDTFADAKEGAVYSLGGEVIVPASGETAEEISIASVVQNPGVLLGGDLNIIRPTENLLPSFLALSISNGSAHREMSKRAQGKSVVHLHNEDLAQIDLKYPSVEEQSKITACINWVDNLITLHQRKLEHLQLLKKALLQQLFV